MATPIELRKDFSRAECEMYLARPDLLAADLAKMHGQNMNAACRQRRFVEVRLIGTPHEVAGMVAFFRERHPNLHVNLSKCDVGVAREDRLVHRRERKFRPDIVRAYLKIPHEEAVSHVAEIQDEAKGG